jgi:hypothetical protein
LREAQPNAIVNEMRNSLIDSYVWAINVGLLSKILMVLSCPKRLNRLIVLTESMLMLDITCFIMKDIVWNTIFH